MNNYNNKSRFGGDRKSGGNRSFSKPSYRDRDRDGGSSFDRGDRPTSYPAVCADCGNSCTVPFKPNGSKPIYCSNCFEKHDDRGDRPSFDREDRGGFNSRPSYSDRPSFRDKPRRDFDNAPKDNSGVEKQLKELNAKLDQLISALVIKEKE